MYTINQFSATWSFQLNLVLPSPSPDSPSDDATYASRSLVQFFVLAIALVVPFWLIGGLVDLDLLPGVPLAGLAFFCPAAAAAILVYRKRGCGGVIDLLRRSFDLNRIRHKAWYAPVLLLMPAVMLVSYGVIRLSGVAIPPPKITFVITLALCLALVIAAVGEEIGWSGYAIDPLQVRWGALLASIGLGLFWAAYHWPGLIEAHRSLDWIAWWSLGTVAARVIIVWIYNNTGKSVAAAALLHMTINLTWQLFPVNGSFYDPRVTSWILALVAVGVTLVWGSRTLSRNRFALEVD